MSEGKTYIGPDGHDKHLGKSKPLRERGPSTNISVAVSSLLEDAEEVIAELRVDLAGLGKTLPGGDWDVDARAVLNKVLGQGIGGELGDDAVLVSVSTTVAVNRIESKYKSIGTNVNGLEVSTARPAP